MSRCFSPFLLTRCFPLMWWRRKIHDCLRHEHKFCLGFCATTSRQPTFPPCLQPLPIPTCLLLPSFHSQLPSFSPFFFYQCSFVFTDSLYSPLPDFCFSFVISYTFFSSNPLFYIFPYYFSFHYLSTHSFPFFFFRFLCFYYISFFFFAFQSALSFSLLFHMFSIPSFPHLQPFSSIILHASSYPSRTILFLSIFPNACSSVMKKSPWSCIFFLTTIFFVLTLKINWEEKNSMESIY